MATIPAYALYGAARTLPWAARGIRMASYGAKAAKYGGAALSAYETAKSVSRYIPKGNNNKRVATSQGSTKTRKTRNTKTLRGYRESGEQGRTITSSNYKKTKKDTLQKKILREALPEKLNRFNQGIIAISEGTQDFNVLNYDWHFNDLNNYATNSDTSESRFWVDKCTAQGMITNTTSTPVKLTLYSLTAKKNLPTTSDPIECIKMGLQSKYNSSTQYKIPFTSPRESSQFIANWKIEDEKTITLSPGENHEFYYSYEIEKYYNSNQAVWKEAPGSYINPLYVKGYTKCIMVRVIPSLVTDSTKVTTAASKILYFLKSSIMFKRPQGSSTNTLLASQYNVPQNGLTSEKFINEDTGDVDTNITI